MIIFFQKISILLLISFFILGKNNLSKAQNNIDLLNKAVELLENGSYKEAEQVLTQLINKEPRNEQAYHLRAKARWEQQNYNGPNGALADFTKAIELNPQNPVLYLERGIANYDLDDPTNAIRDFNSAIQKDPKLAKAWYMRGLAKLDLNNKEGCSDLKKAIELNIDVSEERGLPDPHEVLAQKCK
ncbi:MAG: tetratricopeptide repeat protein [Bacteroidia bacterium]|nr:tetratricopeptide repeat protein [Bacteroidia bacterium]MDW8158211.1 tetratricopeptide repeat protein [Bacteroidia bacterium]